SHWSFFRLLDVAWLRLSLPKIISERSGGAARIRLGGDNDTMPLDYWTARPSGVSLPMAKCVEINPGMCDVAPPSRLGGSGTMNRLRPPARTCRSVPNPCGHSGRGKLHVR